MKNPELTKIKPPAKIYFMGIGGTGMAPLAVMTKQAGFEVFGSDENLYPPMSTLLKEQGINYFNCFRADNISRDFDLIVVGNRISKDHPETVAATKLGLQQVSFPQFMEKVFLSEKYTITVAGTHGKTTTCSALAYVCSKAGLAPSFLIGGLPQDFNQSGILDQGKIFIIEGDEYDSAYFDKIPKFLHYHPNLLILTAIEFDHADIYEDLTQIKKEFVKLIQSMPEDGLIIACGDDPEVYELVAQRKMPALQPLKTIFYGFHQHQHQVKDSYKIHHYEANENGLFFKLQKDSEEYGTFSNPILSGRHNAFNLAAVAIASNELGIPYELSAKLIKGFRGVRRRSEIIFKNEKKGIVIIDDFGHHPTEVKETLQGLRERYRDRELIAIFEPKTHSSRRRVFEPLYEEALTVADKIFLLPVYNSESVPEGSRLSLQRLRAAIRSRQSVLEKEKCHLSCNRFCKLIGYDGKILNSESESKVGQDFSKEILNNLKKPTVVIFFSSGNTQIWYNKLLKEFS